VRRQARWQVDGAKPMMWRFMMLSYVHHHNIPGAWGIVFTALDNIEVLKVSQNQKSYPTTRVNKTTQKKTRHVAVAELQIVGVELQILLSGVCVLFLCIHVD
jgi:hypothetical protein